MTRTSRLQRALPRSSCLSRATRCSPSRLRRCVLAPWPYMQTSLHLILRESLPLLSLLFCRQALE